MGLIDEVQVNADFKETMHELLPELLISFGLEVHEEVYEDMIENYGNVYYKWLEKCKGMNELLGLVGDYGSDLEKGALKGLVGACFVNQILIEEMKKGNIEKTE